MGVNPQDNGGTDLSLFSRYNPIFYEYFNDRFATYKGVVGTLFDRKSEVDLTVKNDFLISITEYYLDNNDINEASKHFSEKGFIRNSMI